AELALLARSDGLEVVAQITQKLENPSPSTYLGKGKVQEIVSLRKETPYDIILFDDELSPSQQRNLEEATGVQVMDRTGLILDIFAQRARTHEGRLQVELAQYDYYLPRLTRLWTHLSRQTRGGVGLRGPGETQLETDRRRVRKRISDLKRELEEVRTHRALHRQRRRAEMVPLVALVGYTNAGKSTLLHALTGADVLIEDKLFATLDPTTRRVKLPRGQEVLFSDTVGFIQKLPTQLVAAFRATLEELDEADLLIHVVDITHPNAALQAQAVGETLKDLKLDTKPVVTALNKIDRLAAAGSYSHAGDAATLDAIRQVALPYPDAVAISAAQGIGLDDLLDRVETVLGADQVDITVLLPYDQGELAAGIRRHGSVLAESYRKDGSHLHLRVPKWFVHQLRPFVAPDN
ncbi:MAG: GTPase HflX, partial [Chloroflexota bacterium]|nr:GTPase HflX [Chloroflexota bacterium]